MPYSIHTFTLFIVDFDEIESHFLVPFDSTWFNYMTLLIIKHNRANLIGRDLYVRISEYTESSELGKSIQCCVCDITLGISSIDS